MRWYFPWHSDGRGHMTMVVVCSLLLLVLLPVTTGNERRKETDLKNGVAKASRYSDSKYVSGHHDTAGLRKNKSYKSSVPKKYVETDDGLGRSPKKSIYDKKYFDYLPSEPEGASVKFRPNSRRTRRDVSLGGVGIEAESIAGTHVSQRQRTKRQPAGIWYVQQQPAIPFPYPIQPPTQFAIYDQGPRGPINPFSISNRQNIDSQYLPPTNTYLPPVNPQQRPEQNPQLPGGVGNRGTFDDQRFLFDHVYDPTRFQIFNNDGTFNAGSRPGGNGFIGTTSRPAPAPAPTIKRPNIFQGPPVTSAPPAPQPRPTTSVATARPTPTPIPTINPGTPAPSGPGSIDGSRTTTAPPPVLFHNSDDDYDWASLGLSSPIDGGFGNRLVK